MHAVVTLLEADVQAAVESLWSDLEGRFGLRGIYRTPYPHFSHQVAATYDLPMVRAALERVAAATAPFSTRAGGLGVFPGPNPVVHVPVVRSAALTALHAALWAALAGCTDDPSEHYRDQRWVPHITLACHDLGPDLLADAVAHLSGAQPDWPVAVTNLALIEDDGERQRITHRLPLTGTA